MTYNRRRSAFRCAAWVHDPDHRALLARAIRSEVRARASAGRRDRIAVFLDGGVRAEPRYLYTINRSGCPSGHFERNAARDAGELLGVYTPAVSASDIYEDLDAHAESLGYTI